VLFLVFWEKGVDCHGEVRVASWIDKDTLSRAVIKSFMTPPPYRSDGIEEALYGRQLEFQAVMDQVKQPKQQVSPINLYNGRDDKTGRTDSQSGPLYDEYEESDD